MNQLTQQPSPVIQDDDGIDLASYLDIILDHRKLIALVALAVTLLGVAYAFVARPIYQSNILIQVEDSPNSSKNILGEMGSLFDVKTAATSEIEILRSRMIVSHAADNLHIYISAKPKFFPLVGAWMARRNKDLSDPGLLGMGGYAWGAEEIVASTFDVPNSLLGEKFTLIAGEKGQFKLEQSGLKIVLEGTAGTRLKVDTEAGNIDLMIDRISAKPGTKFILSRSDRLTAIKDLQDKMVISEKGKQSGIISVVLDGPDPAFNRDILNAIGNEYVRRNVERKSEEAEKSLVFLEKQLPELKKQLELAETKYNQLRNKMGTIDLGEEAKLVLQQSVTTQTKLLELRQKRGELLTRQTTKHPDVVAIDKLIGELNGEIGAITAKIKKLPMQEQEVLRLTRDVKVNGDLYTALLNSAQQLRLVKAGKVGNVRLVDAAALETVPVRPKKFIVIAVAALIGLFLGIICAFIKKSLFGGIEDAHEIEQALGLSVYASIPHSEKQNEIYQLLQVKSPHASVLAIIDPEDAAIESLRSFRTALQFSMLDAKNNVLMITGPTPSLGKSFISVNLAAIMGSTGKKVLLIDADLRKGYAHQYFSLDKKNGLSDLIAGLTLDQGIHKNVVENVDFISTGTLPPNPSEMLLLANFGALMQSLSASYDLVVIDAPPVLVVADTLILAPYAGSVFIVTRAGVSTTGEIKETMKRLSQSGITAKGVILNDLKIRSRRYYGYGYKNGQYRYTKYKY